MARHAPPGQEAQAVTEQPACGHWNGPQARHCGTAPTRHYAIGHRCSRHTPDAIAGRAEPPDGQGPLPGAWTTPTPDAASWSAIDAKHIRSGKRRSTTNDYQAARAAEKRTA